MTYIITSTDVLSQVTAPNLPLAPNEYERRYFDQLTNTMRLYFNQLDKILGQLQVSSELDSVQTQLWLGNSGGMFSG
jgi:hypothetical protein